MTRDPSDGTVQDKRDWCCGTPEKPYCDCKPFIDTNTSKETSWPQKSQSPNPIAAPSVGKDHAAEAQDAVLATSTSGLPITKAKAEYLARLEMSREWLKLNYPKTQS